MSGGQQVPHAGGHHVRFYIVMVTLVIGAVLFLLLMNDDGTGFTSAAILSRDNESADSISMAEKVTTKVGSASKNVPRTVDELVRSEAEKNSKEIYFALGFDQIPRVHETTAIEKMELTFDDLTTTVKVNNDKLELNNLQEVSLTINGFEGRVDFDGSVFSLDGKAQRIAVNDVALSSDQEIRIVFDNLNYESLKVSDVQIKELMLPTGSGSLKVAEKLTYDLSSDQVQLYFFDGSIIVDKTASKRVGIDGTMKGISISGSMLNLNLR